MNTRMIGDVAVSRVEEMCGPGFRPDALLPAFQRDAIAEHADWLMPNHYHEGLDRLVASVHSWVIKTEHHTILVDTCIGNHKERPAMERWHHLDLPFLERLAEAGVQPEEVDFVMCTHLHVDHVGWNTRLDNGRWVPTFPNAKYVFARNEFEHWNQTTDEEAARIGDANMLAFNDSVLPVVEAGLAEMVDGDHQLGDRLLIEPAPGHTPGSCTLKLSSNGTEALFIGDIMHHALQVYYPHWNSCFCVDPEMSHATRRRILEESADRDRLLMPAHFGAPHAGRVVGKGDGFALAF